MFHKNAELGLSDNIPSVSVYLTNDFVGQNKLIAEGEIAKNILNNISSSGVHIDNLTGNFDVASPLNSKIEEGGGETINTTVKVDLTFNRPTKCLKGITFQTHLNVSGSCISGMADVTLKMMDKTNNLLFSETMNGVYVDPTYDKNTIQIETPSVQNVSLISIDITYITIPCDIHLRRLAPIGSMSF